MEQLEIGRAFMLLEPGPAVLVTTNDGKKDNIMTISWTMVMDFTPVFAMTTGEWNYSFKALRKTKERAGTINSDIDLSGFAAL